jgi:hypothetical protein
MAGKLIYIWPWLSFVSKFLTKLIHKIDPQILAHSPVAAVFKKTTVVKGGEVCRPVQVFWSKFFSSKFFHLCMLFCTNILRSVSYKQILYLPTYLCMKMYVYPGMKIWTVHEWNFDHACKICAVYNIKTQPCGKKGKGTSYPLCSWVEKFVKC